MAPSADAVRVVVVDDPAESFRVLGAVADSFREFVDSFRAAAGSVAPYVSETCLGV